ncbi:hypothetical protein [Nocardioides sp. 503]|uniref:hypothetical protein n=1 Tax=Nocardioides sp. 503 TaxID=2508326 RepID=UPI00106F57CB|nr:hypothetical protein [Nocardioides sp. 503]
MRRTLGPLLPLTLLAALLAGCGDDDGTVAEDPPPSSPSASPSQTPPSDEPSPDEPASDEPVVVALVSETGGGGTSSDVLAPVDGPGLDAFLTQVDSATLGEEVRAAVRGHDLPSGHSQGAAVVSVGCDVPPEVFVTQVDGAWTVTPAKVASPRQECYAAVTTVAVVDVPGEIAPVAADPAA